MAVKKSLLVAGATLAVGLASIAGLHSVSAAASGQQSLVDKIAQRFNLNKNDVQKVFDEEHATREAQHKTNLTNRLTQDVKDGKITEDQKAKILAKFDELEKDQATERAEMKDKTPSERRAAREQHRAELEKWAKDNGIPAGYLPFGGPHSGHGPGNMD